MNVFILHGEKDEAAASELKAFLKSRGMLAETETGERGFRSLGKTDVVVALWSKDSVFSINRMQAEKRMLGAWADQKLVLVKLDHSILPVGLRDLPAVDATFAETRALVGWVGAERAAREAIQRAQAPKPEPPPPAPQTGGGPKREADLDDDLFGERSRKSDDIMGGADTVHRKRDMHAPPASKGSSGLGFTFVALAILAVALAGGAALWWVLQEAEAGASISGEAWFTALLAGGGALLAVGLLAIIAGALIPKPEPEREPSRPRSTTFHAEDIFDGVLAPVATPTASAASKNPVFVSYAHADETKVTPVVKVVEGSGRPVWMDKDILQAGESWAGELARAIKGAHGVIVMCSPSAFQSDHIKREVYLADRYKKPMLPVFLEEAKMPDDFEYFFAGVQWLELFKLSEADRPGAIGKALAAV
jgi:hypothetical protein